jgi:hypothetical protein
MPQHVVVVHQVVLADCGFLQHRWVAARRRDGLGAHRHTAVHDDDRKVE